MSKNQIWKFLKKLDQIENITEVMINSPDHIFIEQAGKIIYLDENLEIEHINIFIDEVAKLNNLNFNIDRPMLDGVLPDGSRINIIGFGLTEKFPAITIRKYLKKIISLEENGSMFNLSKRWIDFFKVTIKANFNIIVYGGTGAGKTTFLNLLLNEIDVTQRIVVIEDTRELSLKLPNVIYLKPSLVSKNPELSSPRNLVKNALRMRPDRIIIGEVRGGEAFDLLIAMNTGHSGSMSSIHANSNKEFVARFTNLVLMSNMGCNDSIVKAQLSSGVDLIVGLKKNKNGQNTIFDISEFTGVESDTISINQLAHEKEGILVSRKIASLKMDRLLAAGLPKDFFNNV